MTTTHTIKCHRTSFVHCWTGAKRAEFRLNDRNYQVGDTVVMEEVVDGAVDGDLHRTGNVLIVKITHVTESLDRWCGNLPCNEPRWCLWTFQLQFRVSATDREGDADWLQDEYARTRSAPDGENTDLSYSTKTLMEKVE